MNFSYIRKLIKISIGATEGLVQHTLQSIWVLGLIEKLFVFERFGKSE